MQLIRLNISYQSLRKLNRKRPHIISNIDVPWTMRFMSLKACGVKPRLFLFKYSM